MIIFLVMLLASFFIAAEKIDSKPLIILLEKRGSIENVAKPNTSMTSKLLASLVQAEFPIITSAALWHGILERKDEFEQRKNLSHTQDQWLWQQYTEINNRLNYWYNLTLDQTKDLVHSKDVALSFVNKEFYEKEIVEKWKREKKFPDATSYRALTCSLAPLHLENWHFYYHKGHYICVPLALIEKHDTALNGVQDLSGLTAREIALGLKIDHLKKVDPLDKESHYFENDQDSFDLTQLLRSVMVTQKDGGQEKPTYKWMVYLGGHGAKHQIMNDAGEKTYLSVIADIAIDQFKSFLAFCNTEIPVQILVYKTCFGGGDNARMAFVEDKDTTYTYPIVYIGLSDNFTYSNSAHFSLPHKSREMLEAEDIEYTQEHGWQLAFHNDNDFKAFFDTFSLLDLQNGGDIGKKIQDATFSIATHYWGNLAHLRKAGTQEFITVYAHNNTKLSDSLVALCKAKNIPFSTKAALLIMQTQYAPLTIMYEERNSLGIASIVPGDAHHYIERFEAERLNPITFLSGFFSLAGLPFKKNFLIEELKIGMPTEFAELAKLMGISESVTVLKKLLVKQESDSLLRAFFQTENGISHLMVVRTNKNHKTHFSSLRPLSSNATQAYLNEYETIKKELVESSHLDEKIEAITPLLTTRAASLDAAPLKEDFTQNEAHNGLKAVVSR